MLPENRNTRRYGNSSNKSYNKRRRIVIKKVKNNKTYPKFMAMSKLLGLFIIIALITVVVYAMYEMHQQVNLDSLPQLIISLFGIGSVYIGFYLTMAKWEHIEAEKTEREKEVLKLKKQLQLYNEKDQIQEDIVEKSQRIDDLTNQSDIIQNEEINN